MLVHHHLLVAQKLNALRDMFFYNVFNVEFELLVLFSQDALINSVDDFGIFRSLKVQIGLGDQILAK